MLKPRQFLPRLARSLPLLQLLRLLLVLLLQFLCLLLVLLFHLLRLLRSVIALLRLLVFLFLALLQLLVLLVLPVDQLLLLLLVLAVTISIPRAWHLLHLVLLQLAGMRWSWMPTAANRLNFMPGRLRMILAACLSRLNNAAAGEFAGTRRCRNRWLALVYRRAHLRIPVRCFYLPGLL